MRINFEIASENWHAHENDHGFKFIGFQPTSSNIHANQDCVVMVFADDEAGMGVQIVMSHASYRSFLLTIVKSRKTVEAKQDEHGKEEDQQ